MVMHHAAQAAPTVDESELRTLAAAREAARRSHDDATAACAELEARRTSDPLSNERLLTAQDRAVAARDRLLAAEDRYRAARDRRRAAAYLKISYRDGLTGVLQRQAGLAELRREVDRAHRDHAALLIAFVDVDGLKAINDEQGHLAGDAILHAVGEALRHGLRSYDVIMRFGGDEFVCALPGVSSDEACGRMTDINDALRGGPGEASVSFGLAELRPDDTLLDVMRRADTDLYARRARVRGHAAHR
jgi:diguanylate cyclase (GGDEF)-like protein